MLYYGNISYVYNDKYKYNTNTNKNLYSAVIH